MRSDTVRELFAHDREDLAWLVADANEKRLREIEAAIKAAVGPSWPEDRGAWILAAIEALEGHRPNTAPRRSRSPVLEMPVLLRQRADRNDNRDWIADALRRVQHTRAGWGWLVIEAWPTPNSGPSPFYVQFSSYPGPRVRAEAVGNYHLPPADRLDADDEARMIALGWEPGRVEVSDGNWVRHFPNVRRLDRHDVAEFALVTLEEGFRCVPGVQVRGNAGVWSPEEVGEKPRAGEATR